MLENGCYISLYIFVGYNMTIISTLYSLYLLETLRSILHLGKENACHLNSIKTMIIYM